MYKVYLDNASTTKPYDFVVDYINEINSKIYGNPSSLHKMGVESERIIKEARTRVAVVLDVDEREIIFTSGGTESNNLAVMGYLNRNKRKGNHVITTGFEHPSVMEVFRYLESIGYNVDYVNIDQHGAVDVEELRQKLNNETSMVSIMHVNNEVGAVQDIEQIARIIKSVNSQCVFHVDAVQSFGKFLLRPKNSGIDLLSVSSHKIHGPKGCGMLYINKNIKMMPIIFGGGQENKLRSGTENVACIGAFGKAVESIYEKLNYNYDKVKEINRYFRQLIDKADLDYSFISCENASPYILSIAFRNLKSEVLLHHLEQDGIYVSNGSACSSKSKLYSHVLTAMKVDRAYIDGVIRFSFSEFNEENEVDYVVERLKEIIKKIRIRRGVNV